MDRTLTVSCANDLTIKIYDASVITDDCSPAIFNSCAATDEEIATIREVVGPDTPLCEPPRRIYSFSHFAALVQESQSLAEDEICTGILPLWLAKEIMSVQNSFLITGKFDKSAIKDIEEKILLCKPLADMNGMLQSDKKWFVRMDDCSPKDSEEQKLPISSIHELVICLCTSKRARGDFEAHILDKKPINIFLHTWNDKMGQGVEFRCFLAPWKANNPVRITAISQFHWHTPFPTSRFSPRQAADDAVAFSSLHMLPKILTTATDKDIGADLKSWGFSFDIVVTGVGNAALVEIKPFGAKSGCGSCLFHWVKDAKLLYGGKEGIEVRLMAD